MHRLQRLPSKSHRSLKRSERRRLLRDRAPHCKDGSRLLIRRMTRRPRRQTLWTNFLAPLPSNMLKLPMSPLKVSLQCVDASVMSNDDGNGSTPLHWLAELSDPSQEHTLDNQCILAKQLIKAGANVNARAQRCVKRMTPLHGACSSSNCTNLDLI